MDDQVELRPVLEGDLPVLEEMMQDPDKSGEFAWFGWLNRQGWRRAWDENRLLGGDDGGTLMVVRGSDRLGLVNWRRQQTTPAGYCWEIGIALLPQARGHGYGTQAQRLLARYLFAHTTVHRIWAATETGNLAEQKALEKAGFTREGVLRGCGWRDGAWRDGVVYSLLRTDQPV
jgi:RimJ/RimL family protein N-acetyltransferase